jgi:conjugal transfer pilin signal peptidase TrbI
MDRRRQRAVLALLLGVLLIAGVAYASDRYRVAFDPQETLCDDYKVALIDKTQTIPERGKRFAVRTAGLRWYADGLVLGKQVVGLPGDLVAVGENGVFVNGGRLGVLNPEVLERAELGLADVVRTYRVAPGQVFLFAPSERSFDSRYFGPVAEDQILGRMVLRW